MAEKNTKKSIPLRLSQSLYEEILRWAEDDFRSVNGQIEYLLTECVNKRRKTKSVNNNSDEIEALKKQISIMQKAFIDATDPATFTEAMMKASKMEKEDNK